MSKPSYEKVTEVGEGIRNLSSLLDGRGAALEIPSDTFRIQNFSNKDIKVDYLWREFSNAASILAVIKVIAQPWKLFDKKSGMRRKRKTVKPGKQINVLISKENLGGDTNKDPTKVFCQIGNNKKAFTFINKNQIPSYERATEGLGDKDKGVSVSTAQSQFKVDPIKSIDHKRLACGLVSMKNNTYKSKRYHFTSYLYEIKVR